MHVLAVRAPVLVRRDAPRQGDDVNAVTRFVGALPGGVFVVNDPLEAVHGGFVKFLFDHVILKRTCAQIRSDANIDEVSVGRSPVEIGLSPAGIDASCGRHAHARRSVLVSVVGIERAVGFAEPAARKNADWIRRRVADSIVSSNELLTQARVFVIHAGVDHGNVHVCTPEPEVPSTDGVET